MAKRELQEINAGSMADIAFLLLIFFLVTTTMESNYGIMRKLPPPPDPRVKPDSAIIKHKNVLEIVINGQDKMLIEAESKEVNAVKDIAIKFITNNGRDPKSSDNPDKAVISIKHSRETTYKKYISVYNEIIGAYNKVRNDYSMTKYKVLFTELEKKEKDKLTEAETKILEDIKKKYPQKIAESTQKR
jgi:biopolymer transport protein ExbD